MAIGVPDNFSYGGKKPNFDRDQFLTREAMLAFSPDFLDEGHISYCKEDKKHYKWNGTEWEEFNTGGGAAEYIADFVNGGVVNISSTGDVERVYDSLSTGGVALCIIGDSNGSYPSEEVRVNVNSKYCTSLDYFFSTDPRGANVGDLLMITKQSYLFINRCALKIIPINDAKVASDGFVGTDGIMTTGDKQSLNNVIHSAGDTRNWLSSVNEMLERNIHRTRFGYGISLDECISTGVCAYTPAEINGINENWTLFVDCSSDGDTGGYYHFTQTAIGRTGSVTGKIYQRLGWYKKEGDAIVDLNFLDWQTSGEGGDVDLSEYAKKSELPTKTSQLTNDSGFVTEDELSAAIAAAITNELNSEV